VTLENFNANQRVQKKPGARVFRAPVTQGWKPETVPAKLPETALAVDGPSATAISWEAKTVINVRRALKALRVPGAYSTKDVTQTPMKRHAYPGRFPYAHQDDPSRSTATLSATWPVISSPLLAAAISTEEFNRDFR